MRIQPERRVGAARGGRRRWQLATVTLAELADGPRLPPAEARSPAGRLERRRCPRRAGGGVGLGTRGGDLLDAIRQAQAELMRELMARVPADQREKLIDIMASILRASRDLRGTQAELAVAGLAVKATTAGWRSEPTTARGT